MTSKYNIDEITSKELTPHINKIPLEKRKSLYTEICKTIEETLLKSSIMESRQEYDKLRENITLHYHLKFSITSKKMTRILTENIRKCIKRFIPPN